MSLKVLADENVDFRIVRRLREMKFEVLSVLELAPGIPDKKVIEMARNEKALILTEDSDFGELVFSHKIAQIGVLFLRYVHEDLLKITESIRLVLEKYQTQLHKKFVVITPDKIRIRDL